MALTKREDGLNLLEGDVMDLLIAAWNAYHKLPIQHPDEQDEFANAIHTCQNLLAIRIVRREYPEGWYIKRR